MKDNESLEMTMKLRELMRSDLIGAFYDMFPSEEVAKLKPPKERDRVYNSETTLQTMIMTMVQEDKSLQNSVNIYSVVHEKNKQRILDKEAEQLDEQSQKRKRGRLRKSFVKTAKSKKKSVSSDTSGFSQARQRLSKEIIDCVFAESHKLPSNLKHKTWHGLRVFMTDGTYLQMQDTKEILTEYQPSSNGGYPRALLQVLIEQSSGYIHNFDIGSDKKSELEVFSNMIDTIPETSLILADDLYNCFSILSLLKSQNVEIIVPGKRQRIYKVISKLGNGDEVVEIKKGLNSKWLNGKTIKDEKLIMRRIEYKSSRDENETLVLYTSLLDKAISKEEIILKYASRWDVEISIRELKTLLDINIVRSKTPEMAYKEIAVAMVAYNYLKSIILLSIKDDAFSPEGDIYERYYTFDKQIYVDKLGRKYSRWSPGRNRKTTE